MPGSEGYPKLRSVWKEHSAFACWRRNATARPVSYWWSHKSKVVHCPLLWYVFVKGELVFLQKICHLGEHSSHIQMASSTIGSQLHLLPWRYIVFLVCLCNTAAPHAKEAWHRPGAIKPFFQKFLNWKRRKAQGRMRSITAVGKYNKRSKVQGCTSTNQLYCPHINHKSLLARLCPHRVCTLVSVVLWATSWLGKPKESQEQCSYSPGKRRCYLSERSGKPCPQLGISLELCWPGALSQCLWPETAHIFRKRKRFFWHVLNFRTAWSCL